MCDRRRGEELISRALPFSVDSPGGGSVTSCSQSDKKGRLRQEEEQHKTAVPQKNMWVVQDMGGNRDA